MTADNQQFLRAAAGRIELKGNLYLEHVEYCSVPAQVEKTHRFEVRVEGDKYYQTGMLDDIKLEEVWQRVK